ncbi:MAG: hemolysin III family protein [Clostridia bacterium]|nr:hemolysin III family protein [Clostridia bacterium]
MIAKDVKIIEYPKKTERYNFLTHLLGAVLSLAAIVLMLLKADTPRETACALIYGATLFTVYTASTVYHGLKVSEMKRIARLVDHSAVPLLIAGTTTPCALISLYNISPTHGTIVFLCGWLCALFGIFSKVFFFEKLKVVTMAVYIVCSLAMLLSAVPRLGELNRGGFRWLVLGSVFYFSGAILCGLGSKKPSLHPIFHIFVILGSATHFYAIYCYILH